VATGLDAARHVPLALLVVVFGLSLVNYLLRFVRWELLVGPAGAALPRGRHLLIYIAGFSLTLTPAKAGEALRTLYLLPHGVSARHSLACLAVERVLDVLAVAGLGSLVVALWPQGWLIVLPSLGGSLAVFYVLTRLAGRQAPLPMPEWMPARMQHLLDPLVAALGEFGPRTIVRAIPLSVAGWALEAIGLVLIVHHYVPDASAPVVMGIFGAAVLGGALTFLPGGLGGTELLMVALLSAIGLSGPQALAATAICRLATLWLGFGLGVAAVAVLGLRRAGRAG
jgi:glycosyltransferase 2 family protein